METLFLSYRRDDSAGFAGRLAEDLEAVFGDGVVFRDVDDLQAGEDFVAAIERKLDTVKTVLVMIGPLWAGMNDDGTRRIDDPQDFVRLEISSALASGRPVVPILVGGAGMPAAKDLPDDLEPLARLQAVELSDTRWHDDIDRLIADLDLEKPPGLSLEATPAGRPKRLMGMWATVGLAVLATAFYFIYGMQPSDIDGIWQFSRDGHWAIAQNGDELDVEVFLNGRPHAWMRGSGNISGKTIRVTLLPKYDNPYHHRFACELSLDDTGRRLSGTMRELTKDHVEPLSLKRP